MAGYCKITSTAFVLSVLSVAARAVPQVAFPFNSQVPAVARVDSPYSFQISASTFGPAAENLTYGLLNQPLWLSIDSPTRALTGSPSPSDQGTNTFTLTAADSSGVAYMPCTLVVSSEPAPVLEGGLSAQIAVSANLSKIQPPTVTLLPTTAFRFAFSHSSFIDIVQRKLCYYATLNDHTPLPSWIDFDADSLVFSGVAPELAAFPQSWDVDLIASDVPGFSGSSATFSVAISTEQLVFVPEQQDLFLEPGMHVNYTGLQHQLFRNGQVADVNRLTGVKAGIPPWLSFDDTSLVIEGIVPDDFERQNITVSVTDRFGSTAVATLDIVNQEASVFSRPIGTITFILGQRLLYHLSDSLFTIPNLDLEVNLPASASWISFNAQNRNLEGTVPTNVSSSNIQANLVAKASGLPPQIQPFMIELSNGTATTPVSSTWITVHASPTDSHPAIPHSDSSEGHRSTRLDGGILAAVIVLSLIAAGLLIVCVFLCCRQHRRSRCRHESPKPSNQTLPGTFRRTSQASVADIKADMEDFGRVSTPALPQAKLERPPPRIDVQLPLEGRDANPGWRHRMSRLSKASSLGYGGDFCVNADSNIPELGWESQLLQTPHRSFTIPDKIAKQLKKPSEVSGLQSHTTPSIIRRPHQQKSLGFPIPIISSSLASLSTKATSILSPRPSDFPQPPRTSSDSNSASLTRSDGCKTAKRRTIRLVNTTDLWSDNRPIDVKRQSFIRARASSGQPNPLFAHGSRVSSVSKRQTTSFTSTTKMGRRGKDITATLSQSSSQEPQPRYMRHISCQAPMSFPHVISGLTLDAASQSGAPRDSSSGYSTTSSSIEDEELMKQLALPKQQRSWVLPGEASPTPPPLSLKRKVKS